MDAVSDRRLTTVVVKSSAQIGKTEILLNIAGYFIDQDPSPMLFLQPTMSMSMAFAKDRLTPMCRDSPRLAHKLTDSTSMSKATKKGSTLLQKVFPGGHISLAGMGSASELASRPVRIVLIDEVDRAPINVGGADSGEGDPVSLARKRSQTFWNRKTILVSTPTLEDQSRIEDEWLESDQRRFYVPCPHCEHEQTLEWKNVHWPKGLPHEAQIMCVECAVLWTDVERWKSVSKGYWTATKPEVLTIAGFHINELYSPWSKLGEMATSFTIATRGGPEQLKTWVNTSLGECWSNDEGETVDWESLHTRRESYRHGEEIPAEVSTLVCGADVQDDRIEYEIIGYGAEEQSWAIQYKILIGNPGERIVWQQFAQALRQEFQHPDGHLIPIKLICVDSGGHFTDEVYRFSKDMGRNWVIPIKGASDPGKQIARFPRTPRKENGTYLTMVGTDTAKELIYSRFRITDPGPGYCHFPISDDYDETFFRQVTSEKRVRKYRKGRMYFEWDAGHRRNEALDCRVYALAALRILIQHRGVKLGKMPTPKAAPEEDPTPAPANSEPRKKKRRGSKWAGYEGKW